MVVVKRRGVGGSVVAVTVGVKRGGEILAHRGPVVVLLRSLWVDLGI